MCFFFKRRKDDLVMPSSVHALIEHEVGLDSIQHILVLLFW